MAQWVSLRSLRGGSGNTSLCAGLGEALQRLGQRVLLIDLNPSDMLRLHFTVPVTDAIGWAQAQAQGSRWQEACYQLSPNLHLCAYGRYGIPIWQHFEHEPAAPHAYPSLTFPWNELSDIAAHFDWILIDHPSTLYPSLSLAPQQCLELWVVNPEPATHVLLDQSRLEERHFLLINGLDPSFALGNAILLDWQARYHQQLLPVSMHHDQAFPEALAQKTTVSRWRPHSAGAHDLNALAKWCLSEWGD